MPATITHAYFALDVFNKLDSKTKKEIKPNIKKLMMFAQSSDSLMFYNIMNFKKGKKIRRIHNKHHNKKVNDFFYNLITYIKDNEYYKNPDVKSALYGLICHYTLDSNAHPYIVYKTGIFNSKSKKTYKYNGLHSLMESYIDNYFFKTRYKEKNFNFNSFCFDLKPFSKELNNSLNYVFLKTFNLNNMGKIYYKSLKQMCLFLNLFRIDNYGLKRYLYRGIDLLKSKKYFRFETLSYNVKNIPLKNIFNENHSTWNYPVNKKITSNKSFFEIYEDAVTETVVIINTINDYFYHDKKIDINKLFKNKSYLTGIDCNSKNKQIFFEF